MPGPTTCTFGNTTLSQGFDFTFGPGVTPSVCNLYTIPHVSSLPQVADLAIQTAGEAALVFPDCALEQPRLSVGEGGQRWVLPIMDRRWKWQSGWGRLYGHYNVPRPDGTYIREKTPRELASLCFDAMEESGYDVSRLLNDARPEIHWDGAHPTSELMQLCETLACIPTLNPTTNVAEIWPIGQGRSLPSGFTQGKSYVPILPLKPESLIVEAAPTLFQATFKTEPVGLDTDEKWKRVDDLSYKPTKGWNRTASYGFKEVTGTYVVHGRTLQKRDLAIATVRRCYRISGLANGGWIPDGIWEPNQAPNSLKDFTLFALLADEEISPADGGLRPLPMRVLVKWFQVGVGAKQNHELYTDNYQFDTTTGILTFSEPLFLIGPAPTYDILPAEVRIECSFYAGNAGYLHRRFKEVQLSPGWSSPPRLIQRPDVRMRTFMRFQSDLAHTTEDNREDVDRQLGYWADAAAKEYEPQQGGTVVYNRLLPLAPDGLIQQITWSGGGSRAPSTTVSQAQRHNRYMPAINTLRDRVVAQQLAQARKAEIGKLDADQRALRYASGVV